MAPGGAAVRTAAERAAIRVEVEANLGRAVQLDDDDVALAELRRVLREFADDRTARTFEGRIDAPRLGPERVLEYRLPGLRAQRQMVRVTKA